MFTHDAAAAPGMYCRKCNYALVGLSENRCPECGLPFDPDDPATYRTRVNEGRILRWAKRVLLSLLVLATLLAMALGLLYWRWWANQVSLPAQLARASNTRVGPRWLQDLLGQRFAWLLDRPYVVEIMGHRHTARSSMSNQYLPPAPSTTMRPLDTGTLAAIAQIPALAAWRSGAAASLTTIGRTSPG